MNTNKKIKFAEDFLKTKFPLYPIGVNMLIDEFEEKFGDKTFDELIKQFKDKFSNDEINPEKTNSYYIKSKPVDGVYTLSYSAPGFTKDDFDITINDGILTVTGTAKTVFGEVGIDSTVKIDKDEFITVKLENGILEIVLKEAKSKVTKIKIS